MNKHLFFLYSIIFSTNIYSQIPNTFHYQAVIRDVQGKILESKDVIFRFSISSDSLDTNSIVYQEEQRTKTNEFGLVNLEIGTGLPKKGKYNTINWSKNIRFIEVELDITGTFNFNKMGFIQIQSVPFANIAQDVVNVPKIQMKDIVDVDITGIEKGKVLKYNGNKWIIAEDNQGTNGIALDTNTNYKLLTRSMGDSIYLKAIPKIDTSSRNEILTRKASDSLYFQTLTLSGSRLAIKGGNWVTLPSSNGFIDTSEYQILTRTKADSLYKASFSSSNFYNAKDFGILGDSSNVTLLFNNMIDTVLRKGGGRIILPVGAIVVDSIRFNRFVGNTDLVETYSADGDTVKVMNPIVLEGHATQNYGQDNILWGGTRMYMRGTSGDARITTKATGYLELSHIGFSNKGMPEPTTFIKTTNTTLNIHDCFFEGRSSGYTSADDVCIVLGGNTTKLNNTSNAPFQGYGTKIHNNFFSKISTAVLMQVYANSVNITDNNIWNNCGGLVSPKDAAIIIDGTGDNNSGAIVTGNLIEVGHYKYGINLVSNVNQSYFANNFYDSQTSTTSAYHIGTNICEFNTLQEIFTSTDLLFTDNEGRNNIIRTSQNAKTKWNEPHQFNNDLILKNKYNSGQGLIVESENGYNQQWNISNDSSAILRLTYPNNSSQFDLISLRKQGIVETLDFDSPILNFHNNGEMSLQPYGRILYLSSNKFYLLGDGTMNATSDKQDNFKMPQFGNIAWSKDGNTSNETNVAITSGTQPETIKVTKGGTAQDPATGGIVIPQGTTDQRPANPETGTLRFNTTVSKIEYFNGTIWMQF
jgi:hypothetical protein